MLDTLETLCCLDGVSGSEDEIRDYVLERCLPFADEIKSDPMGNLLVFKKGAKAPAHRVMLCAHMDEVGLIVTQITDDGYLKFDFAGGVDRRVILGKRVFVGAERVLGVVGMRPFHLVKAGQEQKIPPLEELYIDIGASDRAEAEAMVRPGDCVAFDDTVTRFGDGFLKAKAIDDRVGCAAMLELIESELACDCWFAFTVQEEVGSRGAVVAARIAEPEIALILEGTTSCDMPDVTGVDKVCCPGKGVVIPFMDKSTIYNRELVVLLTALADKNGMRWQTKSRVAGGTDAAAVQRTGCGAKVAALSVAVRNLHSPACVAKIGDCEDQLKLARLFLEAMAQ
jgi:Cellulase M and related proteins